MKSKQRLYVMVAIMIVSWACLATPTPTTESFDYQVRVEDKGTRTSIKDAKVTVELGGENVYIEAFTDDNGLARLFIDTAFAGKPGRLIIEADGYEPFRRNIDLYEANLPEIIQLSQLATVGPTETFTPVIPAITDTAIPTATQPHADSLFEEDFEGTVFENFSFVPQGSSIAHVIEEVALNHVFEAVNLSSDASTETRIELDDGKLFSNGSIEFRFKYIDFITAGEEDDGSFDFHFRESEEEGYVLTIRASSSTAELYYVDSNGDWEPGPRDDTTFQLVKNEWYSVRIKAIGPHIDVYLGHSLDDISQPVIQVIDTKLEAGQVDLYIRQNIHVQLDDIRVREVTATELEQQLLNANVPLTGDPAQLESVRKNLEEKGGYYFLGQYILRALQGQRLRQPVPLDVINAEYKKAIGKDESEPISPSEYEQISAYPTALIQAWQRVGREAVTNLAEIVEPIP